VSLRGAVQYGSVAHACYYVRSPLYVHPCCSNLVHIGGHSLLDTGTVQHAMILTSTA